MSRRAGSGLRTPPGQRRRGEPREGQLAESRSWAGQGREGKLWGYKQRGGRNEGRGALRTRHWCGGVGIRDRGQMGFCSCRTGSGSGGGQELVWHVEERGRGSGILKERSNGAEPGPGLRGWRGSGREGPSRWGRGGGGVEGRARAGLGAGPGRQQ